VILDEASHCWPVRPVWTVRCFYGPLYIPEKMTTHADDSVMCRVETDVAFERRVILCSAAVSSGRM